MKKTFIIALAGMMLFAFTQCGGDGGTGGGVSSKSTKQFKETKEAFDEIGKMIKDADNCEDLQEAAFTLVLGSLAVGLGGDQYTAEEKMTEKENEQIKKLTDDLTKEAEKKAEKMGCDLGLDE